MMFSGCMDDADLKLELGEKCELEGEGVTKLEWHNWKLGLRCFESYLLRGGKKEGYELENGKVLRYCIYL